MNPRYHHNWVDKVVNTFPNGSITSATGVRTRSSLATTPRGLPTKLYSPKQKLTMNKTSFSIYLFVCLFVHFHFIHFYSIYIFFQSRTITIQWVFLLIETLQKLLSWWDTRLRCSVSGRWEIIYTRAPTSHGQSRRAACEYPEVGSDSLVEKLKCLVGPRIWKHNVAKKKE